MIKSAKVLFAVLTIILFGALAVNAQSTNPIRWRVSVKMTSPTEGTLTVKALVADGWHLYGTKLPENGPVATALNFSESKGVKFTDAFRPSVAPVEKVDEVFGMKLTFWGENVTFTRHFKLTGAATDAIIKGSVRYMGCNDKNCLPPSTENFNAKVKPFAQ